MKTAFFVPTKLHRNNTMKGVVYMGNGYFDVMSAVAATKKDAYSDNMAIMLCCIGRRFTQIYLYL